LAKVQARMRDSLCERLRCPKDLGALRLSVDGRDPDGHVLFGRLDCSGCGRAYPIREGVPWMLLGDSSPGSQGRLRRIQQATVRRFGFEWSYFRDWGWLADYPDVPGAKEKFSGALMENSRAAFWSKSLFGTDELCSGELVLDAGCGNGRFTFQAARTGAEIIGVDLGWGVYSAFDHTRNLPNVHILRGDLFNLPFGPATFDKVFSIGVLMHTGDPAGAFASLVRTLRPGGLVVAHVYGKGQATFEATDALIRAATTRLPIKGQVKFARAMAAVARWLRKGGTGRRRLYKFFYRHAMLLPTEHHMYDWWSAPIATHHTPEEVRSWFAYHGLVMLRSNPPLGDRAAEEGRRLGHGAITVLGRRPEVDEGTAHARSGS
jgi:SAM-dependent methyltransferase/uncharacterized protein YbaR (Trm112 family)